MSEHIIVHQAGYRMECIHCEQTYAATLPCPLEVWSAMADAFAASHRHCRPLPVALIACCKSKRDGCHPAAELYTGQLFRAQLAYARRVLGLPDRRIFVLSAKYGLVPIAQPIVSYDETLGSYRAAQRHLWGGGVVSKLVEQLPAVGQVYVMAGKLYQEPLARPLVNAGATVRVPHPEELGYARQAAWYRDVVARCPGLIE